MCKDDTIKKSKPQASVDLYRELGNFNSIPCTMYIEEQIHCIKGFQIYIFIE